MKVNQLGTLAILGVVVSFTVACNGSPTKPTAINPPAGDGASVASVNLSTVMPVGAVGQTCTSVPATFDDYGYQIEAETVTCDSPAVVDQPQDEIVVSDAPPMESARFIHRLRR